LSNHHTEFLTATITNWQHLLADDTCKKIIIDSLQWLTKFERCKVFAFVIMPNQIHLLWRIEESFKRVEVQGTFFSFTAHAF
jgi:REP element-mobilizing transposase RayT